MVAFVNELNEELGSKMECSQFIISGGVKSFLDGHFLMGKLNDFSVYGQASSLLKHAEKSYEELEQYLYYQVEGLKLAKAFFKVR
jgi:isopentenyl-diphosphate delta-isomerase